MSALSIERATLDSLRFESGLMPPVERRALHSAQALLRRIDRVLAVCDEMDDSMDPEVWPWAARIREATGATQ